MIIHVALVSFLILFAAAVLWIIGNSRSKP
jgi:hypothetical protein